jgi:hypothetical protein
MGLPHVKPWRILPNGLIEALDLAAVLVLEDIHGDMQEVLDVNDGLITQAGQHKLLLLRAGRI